MKTTLIIPLFLLTTVLFSQNKTDAHEKIPDQLLGTWELDLPGEGDIPSQIFRWVFNKTTDNTGESEFHWLFKRKKDPKYITVGVFVSDFNVQGNAIGTRLKKVGSMQKELMQMEFYDEVKWHYPGDDLFTKSPQKGFYIFEIKENLLLLKEGNNDEVQKYSRVE
ncbi:hypothetical protein [Aestuariivivens sediminis]|uniref:hypothetical protein n=1 Tax=Aestuariivivens sediminis TaxID=2913557 RepID=UPI001F58AFC6|nr:hypothetical protein [Aestuariivivens sediminis]